MNYDKELRRTNDPKFYLLLAYNIIQMCNCRGIQNAKLPLKIQSGHEGPLKNGGGRSVFTKTIYLIARKDISL